MFSSSMTVIQLDTTIISFFFLKNLVSNIVKFKAVHLTPQEDRNPLSHFAMVHYHCYDLQCPSIGTT